MKRTTVTLLLLSILSSTLLASAPKEDGVAITIYNDDFAVVKDKRFMEFEKGTNKILFSGVASAIDPTSVIFKALGDSNGITILEQNYNYDLVNLDALLKRYIDKDVSLQIKGSGANVGSLLEGKLLSYVGNDIVVQTGNGLQVINRSVVENITLENLPGDLVTKPTLLWLANSSKSKNELCQITYTTERINWKADYLAILNENDDALDLSGWVTINNRSGASYDNAAIKLIAGDVRREKQQNLGRHSRKEMVYSMAKGADGGFQEKAFMDYHLYTLGRESTIQNNQIKQIQLIEPAINVPSKKIYVYEVSKSNWITKSNKVQTKIEFENKEQNSLGIAIPKGKIRVFKKDDADGGLEFVGEDSIDHTARKEKISLYIGDAFDIVPEMKIADAIHNSRYDRINREVTLKNRKDCDVVVYVDEKITKYQNLRISDNSTNYEMIDAYTARFKVKIKADSVATIKYTATVTW